MKLYDDLAAWWPLISAPADYAEEAAFYSRALADSAAGPVARVLELGSGGGNNASHMKARWDLTLVDPAPGMIEVSRALNPDCRHVEGDMRTVRLNETFDGVFIHDAICYMTTEDDLLAVMRTAFLHLRPGGAALFAPDHVRESFRPGTRCGGHDDQATGRAARYLEWSRDPDPSDSTYTVDYAFALHEPDGGVRLVHDRHIEGLFPQATWLDGLTEVGFVSVRSVPVVHLNEGPDEQEAFTARRP